MQPGAKILPAHGHVPLPRRELTIDMRSEFRYNKEVVGLHESDSIEFKLCEGGNPNTIVTDCIKCACGADRRCPAK